MSSLIILLILVVAINILTKRFFGVSPLTAFLVWRRFKKFYNLSRFDLEPINLDLWEVTNYNDYIIRIRLNSKDERKYEDFRLLVDKNGEGRYKVPFNQKEFIEFVTIKR